MAVSFVDLKCKRDDLILFGNVVGSHQFATDGVFEGEQVGRLEGVAISEALAPQQAAEVEVVVESAHFLMKRSQLREAFSEVWHHFHHHFLGNHFVGQQIHVNPD